MIAYPTFSATSLQLFTLIVLLLDRFPTNWANLLSLYKAETARNAMRNIVLDLIDSAGVNISYFFKK